MSERFDIIISGASFTGLTLALALSRALGGGLKIAVAGASRRGLSTPDAASKANHSNPRAFAIAAGSKTLLDGLGVWEAIADDAQPVVQIEITDSALEASVRSVLLTYDNLTSDAAPASFIVPDAALSAAVNAVASADTSISFLGDARTVDFSADGAIGRLTFDDGRVAEASLVVGAEGRRSATRDAAGIGLVNRDYSQTGIVVQVEHDRPHNGVAVQHFLPGGPFAILPMRGNRSCITWSEQAETASRILALDDAAFLEEVERRFGGRLGGVKLASAPRSWPLSMHLARAFTASRLALIGDTARGVHPIAGQGLNLGFRDVAALAEVIADQARLGLDIGSPTVLDRYAQWRRFDSVQSTATFDAFNRLFSSDNVLLRSMREAGLGIVDRLGFVKQMLVKEAAGLQGDVPKLLRGEAI